MTSLDREYLLQHPEYIEILKTIVEHEKELDPADFEDKNCLERFNEKNDTDHDVYWRNTDVDAHPSKLYQLEANGFIHRVLDTNSATFYSLSSHRGEAVELINSIDRELQGGMRVVKHDFPDMEELDGLFDDVVGYDDVKWLLKRALTTDDITNVILFGPTGSAKTVFLMCINNYLDDSYFMSGKPSSGPGVLDRMFKQTPKYMLIDEMDDMDNGVQEVLSQYTETGIIDETKIGKDRQMETNTKTFGSANYPDDIIEQVNDRFLDLHFEPYDYEEFIEICEHILPDREDVSENEAAIIGEEVWNLENEADVRKAIQVARLSRGDPQKIIGVLNNYSQDNLKGIL